MTARAVAYLCLFFGILLILAFVGTMWLYCYMSPQWATALCWQAVICMASALTLLIIAGVLIRDNRCWR